VASKWDTDIQSAEIYILCCSFSASGIKVSEVRGDESVLESLGAGVWSRGHSSPEAG